MIRIAILCLLLTGCGGMRQINVGAQVPWYIGTPSDIRAYMVREGGEPLPFPVYYGGLYDKNKQVVLSGRSFDDSKDKEAQELGWKINEFCHLSDAVGNHWAAAALISGGDLNALCDDMSPEGKAAAKAIAEYRKALVNTK